MTFASSLEGVTVLRSPAAIENTLRSVIHRSNVEALIDGTRSARQLVREFGVAVRAVQGRATLPTVDFDWFRRGEDVEGNRLDVLAVEDATQILLRFGAGTFTLVPITDRYNDRVLRAQWTSPLLEAASQHANMNTYLRVPSNGYVDTVDIYYVLSELRRVYDDRIDTMRAYRRSLLAQSAEQPPKKPVRSGQGDFGQFFNGALSRLTVDPYGNDSLLDSLTILDHGTLSSRRWGIEIEHPDTAGVHTPRYWENHYDPSIEGERNYSGGESVHDVDCESYDSGDDSWCDQYDGCQGGDYTTPTEWTSPILRSFHSRGLEELCSNLVGRLTNATAGIHVHVEASDLSAIQAARVSLYYSLLEPLFEQEYERETRSYCQSTGSEAVAHRLREARQFVRRYGANQDVRAFSAGDRYTTVNLQALGAHGTIEFRAMGPRYEYETLILWASFCREMVNLAKSDVPQRAILAVTTVEELVAMLVKYGKETSDPNATEPKLESLRYTPIEGVQYSRDGQGTGQVFDDFDSVSVPIELVVATA